MESPIQPGEVLVGKYRVEHVLGQGGMGVVVAVRHVELDELFAIKLMLDHALTDGDAVERFIREARAAVRLKGEHVTRVVDVGRLESGAPYMVMEHLEGQSLAALVEAQGRLPLDEAVGYLLQVCEALAEAHGRGIIHRDIKPSNLFLVRRPNGTPCVKVLDFGISKVVDPERVELTQTGAMLGSPLYAAPEQMLRTKGADARSDIWSMGVVLYELTTGTVPFPGETVTEVVAHVMAIDPAPPSEVCPGLSTDLDAVIARCLEKEPDDRFQAIGELAAALRPLVGLPAQEATPAALPLPVSDGSIETDPASAPAGARTLQGATVDTLSAVPAGRRTRVAAYGLVALCLLAAAGFWLTGSGPDRAAVAAPSGDLAPVASGAGAVSGAPGAPLGAPTGGPDLAATAASAVASGEIAAAEVPAAPSVAVPSAPAAASALRPLASPMAAGAPTKPPTPPPPLPRKHEGLF